MRSREDLKARYRIFDKFAVKDQKNYYRRTVAENRRSAVQVNQLRATFALLSGLSAALAGLLSQIWDGSSVGAFVQFLAVMAVVMPAVGAIFNTLADLYQWDKLTSIYDSALENMEAADALSPSDKITENDLYEARLHAFAEGALMVMNDETAQWGQSIRTPDQIEAFVTRQAERASRLRDDLDRTDDSDRADDSDGDGGTS